MEGKIKMKIGDMIKKVLTLGLILSFLIVCAGTFNVSKASAATTSDAQSGCFDTFEVYISSLKQSPKVGNEQVGFYWSELSKKNGGYQVKCYYSKTKNGTGKLILTNKYDKYDFDDTYSYHDGYQRLTVYTNGKTNYIVYDTAGKNAIYYGKVGKQVNKISGVPKAFNDESIFYVYDNKAYFSAVGEDSGAKWNNERDVELDKYYVYDPVVGKPKRILTKYSWLGASDRYIYCQKFSHIEEGEWWNWSGWFQLPDYPEYDTTKIMVYDCKTKKIVKEITGKSLGLIDDEFLDRESWYETNDFISGTPKIDYDEENKVIMFSEYNDKLAFKQKDTIVLTDRMGNIQSTIKNAKGYWYPISDTSDKFAVIDGSWDDKILPLSVTIYNSAIKETKDVPIAEGEVLINITQNYAYTMPLDPEKLSNDNMKLKVFRYDLKSGNKTTVVNTNMLRKNEVDKAVIRKGKLSYLCLDDLFSTKNYVYWSAKFSMYSKYSTDRSVFIGEKDPGYTETVYYRYNKNDNTVKKLTQKTYKQAYEKFSAAPGTLLFDDCVGYSVGQEEFYRINS